MTALEEKLKAKQEQWDQLFFRYRLWLATETDSSFLYVFDGLILRRGICNANESKLIFHHPSGRRLVMDASKPYRVFQRLAISFDGEFHRFWVVDGEVNLPTFLTEETEKKAREFAMEIMEFVRSTARLLRKGD